MSEKKGLSHEARVVLEGNIDYLLEKPKETEESYGRYLGAMGIESNLETILSFITGFLAGIIQDTYVTTHRRNMNQDEIADLTKIMKRRAFEIRMAFMNTRIEE